MIPLSTPHISGNEWTYIKECLDTGWVSSVGSYVDKFETLFAEFVGAKYAVATCNGTAALHVSLVALGVKPEVEILAPSITFAATINAIRYCNAIPVFFDCDEFFNIDLDAVEQFLSEECIETNGSFINKKTNRRVWGILPAHIFGNPIDMTRLCKITRQYNLHLLEDAAESLGSFWQERHTGTFGELGCFSFNGNKILTTGGGGMVVTDSEELAKKIRYLTTQAKDDSLRFIHHEVGYNYRLTNIQAAMGVAQLELLPKFLIKKKEIHTRYCEKLADISQLKVCPVPASGKSNYWLTNIKLLDSSPTVALDLVQKLSEAGIQARPIWYPNHLQTTNEGCQAYRVTRAARVVEETVSLPSSVGLGQEDQERVIGVIREIYKKVG